MKNMGFAERFRKAVAASGLPDTQEALGKLLGVSSVMIWSYKTGDKVPRMNTAIRMADKLGVNVNWLLTGSGQMIEPNVVPVGKTGRPVPLISWVQAGDWCEASDPFEPGDAESWHDCPRDHSGRTYALRVRGESMAPRFQPGEIIMVDPESPAYSGRFVIAKKTGNNEVTFKQLVIEGRDSYLKALNPHWPEPIIRIDEEWIICGTVICKVELF